MCLKDMIVEMPEEIERIFADYKMNLVQVRESGQYVFHNEDVKTVFEVSREIFKGNFDKIRTRYRDKEIKSELLTVIGKITDSAELMRQGSSQEGREENIRDLILEWTKDGYSVQEIAKLLKRSEDFVRKIQEGKEVAKNAVNGQRGYYKN